MRDRYIQSISSSLSIYLICLYDAVTDCMHCQVLGFIPFDEGLRDILQDPNVSE